MTVRFEFAKNMAMTSLAFQAFRTMLEKSLGPCSMKFDLGDCEGCVMSAFHNMQRQVLHPQERVVVGNLKEAVEHLHAELAEGVQPGFVQHLG